VTASVGAVVRAGLDRWRRAGAADEAMYAAKRDGKNRVVVHEAGVP
jgi:PleD family two-component response regulator